MQITSASSHMSSQWHLHIISRPSTISENSSQLKVYPPSIQWRWIQKVCLRVWLCAHHIITSFPPVQWFHWGHGEEGQECLQDNWWIPKCWSKSTTSDMRHPYLDRSSFSHWNSSWMTSTSSRHFKTLKTNWHMSDLAETHWNTELTEGTVSQSTSCKGSMSAQSEWTSRVLSQQTRDRLPDQVDRNCNWNLGLWLLIHDPRQSLQEKQSWLEAHLLWWYVISRPLGRGKEDRAHGNTVLVTFWTSFKTLYQKSKKTQDTGQPERSFIIIIAL